MGFLGWLGRKPGAGGGAGMGRRGGEGVVLGMVPMRNTLVRVVGLPGGGGGGIRLIAPKRRGWLQKLVGRGGAGGDLWAVRKGGGVVAADEKAFDLDELGAYVWGACDGKATVEEIVRGFARAQRVNQREAQVAVVMFLRTLMGRNLVALRGEKGINSCTVNE